MKRKLLSMLMLAGSLAALAAGPEIKIDQAVHDFGSIKEADGPVTHAFIITNTGDAPLVVISANAACGCTTPIIPREPIKPGESAELKVKYDPKGRPGEFSKSVRVKLNTKDGRTSLKIKGVVVPASK